MSALPNTSSLPRAALEADISAITGEVATVDTSRTPPLQDLLVAVRSGGVTFLAYRDGGVDSVRGTCPSCGREHTVAPRLGKFGREPRAAYRHLRRKLDQPTRGPLGRAFRRWTGCGCQTSLF